VRLLPLPSIPQAGCVPVQLGPDGWQVLLVSTRKHGDVWVFPKGGVKKSEKRKVAAVRETREEGGVTGTLGAKLGTFEFKHGPQKMWLLYVDTVLGDDDPAWAERANRPRRWVSLADAPALLSPDPVDAVAAGERARRRRPELLAVLDAAVAALAPGLSDPAAAVAAAADGEGAEEAAAEAAAATTPHCCEECIGKAGGCGGRGCSPGARPVVLAPVGHGASAAGELTSIRSVGGSLRIPNASLH